MLWATRELKAGEDFYIQELFEAQRVALGSPRHMMLIVVDGYGMRRRLFVGLAGGELLKAYYGCELCMRHDLPNVPALLTVHQDVFQAMFQSEG